LVIAYRESAAEGNSIVVVNERGDEVSRMSAPRLALVMPYYRNPRMLNRHLQVWRDEWSADLKRDVDVVIVDDGSPTETAAEVLSNVNLTGLPSIALYRMTEDRLWGQHAARNVGAHEATAPWMLMTDADHVVPPSTLRKVLDLLPLGKLEVLTFGRVDAPVWFDEAEDWPEFSRTRRPDGSLKPHVNSFCISRYRYWQLGGYDESFTGIYGCDQEFRTRLWKRATERHLEHAPLIRVDRDVIPDASTRDVERKKPENSKAKKAVRLGKVLRGEKHVVKSLTFPYERVL
jgi:glycosyltransferase involved in cell wall biosynthesis